MAFALSDYDFRVATPNHYDGRVSGGKEQKAHTSHGSAYFLRGAAYGRYEKNGVRRSTQAFPLMSSGLVAWPDMWMANVP